MRIACSGVLLSLLATMASTAWSQTAIIADDFNTIGTGLQWDRVWIAGQNGSGYATTVAPSDANLPGGTWTKVAGWSWGDPFIPAMWDGGTKDLLNFGEDVTGVATPMGSFNTTAALRISADLNHFSSNNSGSVGLGFYSVLGAKNTGGGAFTHFTGLVLTENSALSSSLQVYADGVAVGPAVETGAFDETHFYNLAYDIDTATGGISNIALDGVAVSLTATAFTPEFLRYAAAVQSGGQNGRGSMDNFTVSALPEPAALTLIALPAWLMLRRRSLHAPQRH